MNKHNFILISGFVLLLAACSEPLDVKSYEYTRLLTGQTMKVWAIDHYAFVENGEISQNGGFANCVKDDEHIFYANAERTFIINNGAVKCASTEDDLLVSDSWAFNNATATLVIQLDFFPYGRLPYIVRKLDKDDLVLEIFLDEEARTSYRFYFKLIDEE